MHQSEINVHETQRWAIFAALAFLAAAAWAQQPSTKNGEWPSYTGDIKGTRYSPLDQINASNFNQLEVAWRFKTDSLGTRPEYKLEGTPLMVKGVIYTTAGTRRSVVALDAKTGELMWVYSLREGNRAAIAPRQLSGRGVSYWTDGKGDDRVIFVTTGYRLIALNAHTGQPVNGFGKNGMIDLKEGMVTGTGQQIDLETGEAGLHSTPLVVKDTVIVGLLVQRGNDRRDPQQHQGTGASLRRAQRQTSVDLQHYSAPRRVWQRYLGERFMGHQRQHRRVDPDDRRRRPWSGVSASGVSDLGFLRGRAARQQSFWREPGLRRSQDGQAQVAFPDCASPHLGLRSVIRAHPGRHQRRWESDQGRRLADKEAFLYVFDRVTGEPVWPIEERAVPQSDVPGEKTSPTQPFPTKPPAYARNFLNVPDDLIDFTPEMRAQAKDAVARYKTGPMFLPPVIGDAKGYLAALDLGNASGGTNWPGSAYDPETHTVYAQAHQSALFPLSLRTPPPGFSDIRYVMGRNDTNFQVSEGPGFGSAADAPQRRPVPPPPPAATTAAQPAVGALTVQGLSIVKPPYAVISAINLDRGELQWQVPYGETPDAVRNHPALKGMNIPNTGQPGSVGLIVTKTLVILGDSQNTTTPSHPRGAMLRAYDKATGKEVGAVYMPAPQSGSPMTYLLDGKQYIVVAVSGGAYSGEYIAYSLPSAN